MYTTVLEPGPLACQANTLPLDPAPASDSHSLSVLMLLPV